MILERNEWKNLIDTHTHYAHSQFDEDREEMLKKAFDTGIDALINIAIKY